MADEQTRNEGEGSRTAARDYNERTRQFTEKEDVEARAREAAALDTEEGQALREAENEGRAHAHEEDPQVHRDRQVSDK